MECRPDNWERNLIKEARKRAKRKGLRCALTVRDVQRMARHADGRCEFTGLAFDFSPGTMRGAIKRPYVPSLDRVDTELGYELGNVRLVTAAANIALGQWGEGVYRRHAIGYVLRHPDCGAELERLITRDLELLERWRRGAGTQQRRLRW